MCAHLLHRAHSNMVIVGKGLRGHNDGDIQHLHGKVLQCDGEEILVRNVHCEGVLNPGGGCVEIVG